MRLAELGEIADFINGAAFKPADWGEEGRRIIRIQNLNDPTKPFNRTTRQVPDKYLVPPGTLLVSWSASLGVFEWHEGDTALLNQHIFKVEPNPDRVDQAYLRHMLENALVDMSRHHRGSTMVHVNRKEFLGTKIPLPPLEEQRRIAAILDQADALRRLRHRALDRLNTLGQAIFHEMFGSPSSNPKGFRSCVLGDIVKFIGGSQPAKKHFLYEDGPDVVRFVQTRDFRTSAYKTYVPKDLAKRPFSEDDVIIGRYGPPVFQIFRGLSGTYNVALMKAEPIGEVTRDFVFYLLKEPSLHGYVVANSERTAGQSGVNLALLNAYPVYEPPIGMQRVFSARVQKVNNAITTLQHALECDEALFVSLQHRAFRGEL